MPPARRQSRVDPVVERIREVTSRRDCTKPRLGSPGQGGAAAGPPLPALPKSSTAVLAVRPGASGLAAGPHPPALPTRAGAGDGGGRRRRSGASWRRLRPAGPRRRPGRRRRRGRRLAPAGAAAPQRPAGRRRAVGGKLSGKGSGDSNGMDGRQGGKCGRTTGAGRPRSLPLRQSFPARPAARPRRPAQARRRGAQVGRGRFPRADRRQSADPCCCGRCPSSEFSSGRPRRRNSCSPNAAGSTGGYAGGTGRLLPRLGGRAG